MLELTELKRLHDKAYQANILTREKAADDLVFYWVTQWDDNYLGNSTLEYRGEFNILRKAGRQIMADLRTNPVQVDFNSVDEEANDGEDLLDGMYRTDEKSNDTQESMHNGSMESVVCGVGAWERYTEYVSNDIGNENQVIKARPVYEANNVMFWDPNAKKLDKSDANYVSVLTPYSQDGYKDLVEELTGERPDQIAMESFSNPEESYTYPWINGEQTLIWVTNFYQRKEEKEKVLFFEDPLGHPLAMRERDIEDIMDELIDSGYSIVGERQVRRWVITKYIASGAEILSEDRIAGQNIPIIPVYGERAFVEGSENWEGVTRLAKDPQRLRNFQMSYLADIVSRSPRPKPIFLPEQIGPHAFMYEENGSENNYPYYFQEQFDANGNPLPLGPVGVMPEQPMPQALVASIGLSKEAVEDVANPGLPQDIADPDVSGKAVLALQSRLDQQSIVYQENMKHAKRRDGEVYASMASEVFDTPRTVVLTLPDGTRKTTQLMQAVMDEETGEPVVINDLTSQEFNVTADIGPAYGSRKEQTLEQLGQMAQEVAQTDPNMHKALIMKRLMLMDGVDMDDIRDYANKQLILSGFKQPETEEELAFAQQAAQQTAEPDAATMLAMAEMEKAKAAQMREQREAMKDQANAQNDNAQTQIDVFKAQTDRLNTQVDAAKAGADINYKEVQTFGQQLENAAKASEGLRVRLRPERPQLRLVE